MFLMTESKLTFHMWAPVEIMRIENGKLTYVTIVVVLSFLYHSFVEHSSFISRDKCIIGYRNIVAVVQYSVRHVPAVFGWSQWRHWLRLLLLELGSSRSTIGIRFIIRIRRASIWIGCGVLGCRVCSIRRTRIMIIQIMAAVTEWWMIRSI